MTTNLPTWTKLRHCLPANDNTPVRVAYEQPDGTIDDTQSVHESHVTTGEVLNRLAALYGLEAPSSIGGAKTCWQYVEAQS